jgi:hypothetical protein
MKAQTVNVKVSTGRILCCTVFRPGGKKLLAKGHVISEDDIRILESEGMEKVWVTELEEGEVGEDEAVSAVAGEMGCGCYEIHLAAGGRANLHATENCCLLVDEELLRQINCISSVVIATSLNFSFAMAGQRRNSQECAFRRSQRSTGSGHIDSPRTGTDHSGAPRAKSGNRCALQRSGER